MATTDAVAAVAAAGVGRPNHGRPQERRVREIEQAQLERTLLLERSAIVEAEAQRTAMVQRLETDLADAVAQLERSVASSSVRRADRRLPDRARRTGGAGAALGEADARATPGSLSASMRAADHRSSASNTTLDRVDSTSVTSAATADDSAGQHHDHHDHRHHHHRRRRRRPHRDGGQHDAGTTGELPARPLNRHSARADPDERREPRSSRASHPAVHHPADATIAHADDTRSGHAPERDGIPRTAPADEQVHRSPDAGTLRPVALFDGAREPGPLSSAHRTAARNDTDDESERISALQRSLRAAADREAELRRCLESVCSAVMEHVAADATDQTTVAPAAGRPDRRLRRSDRDLADLVRDAQQRASRIAAAPTVSNAAAGARDDSERAPGPMEPTTSTAASREQRAEPMRRASAKHRDSALNRSLNEFLRLARSDTQPLADRAPERGHRGPPDSVSGSSVSELWTDERREVFDLLVEYGAASSVRRPPPQRPVRAGGGTTARGVGNRHVRLMADGATAVPVGRGGISRRRGTHPVLRARQ